MSAVVHWHTSEDMSEIADGSVKLLLGSCTHTGGWDTWVDYLTLLSKVFCANGHRVLRPDGYLVVAQTDCYIDGQVMPRSAMTLTRMMQHSFPLLDVKVWQRKKADLRLPPNTYFYVFANFQGTARRPSNKDTEYFEGVWRHPADTSGKGMKLNGWPDALCRMFVRVFTEPGDLIVDPFCGTANLLGIADSVGRNAVGYEIDTDLKDAVAHNLCRKREV